jgi:glutathione S-transferase
VYDRYTKNLPTSSSATDSANATAAAAAGVARSGRPTQLGYTPVLGSRSPARPNIGNPVEHAGQRAEDDHWRKELLATLNNKLATRELLASEGVNAADLRVIDEEIAAIREARSEPCSRVVHL